MRPQTLKQSLTADPKDVSGDGKRLKQLSKSAVLNAGEVGLARPQSAAKSVTSSFATSRLQLSQL